MSNFCSGKILLIPTLPLKPLADITVLPIPTPKYSETLSLLANKSSFVTTLPLNVEIPENKEFPKTLNRSVTVKSFTINTSLISTLLLKTTGPLNVARPFISISPNISLVFDSNS